MKYGLHAFALALLFTSGLDASAATLPARHTVTVEGHPIAVWSRVPARAEHAILLVHGRTWSTLPDFDLQPPGERRSVMQALEAAHYAVYGVDLRGYGDTPRNADGWSLPNQSADDVAQVLDWIHRQHPRLRKPALFGWSMGSMVAQLTAQRHPQAMSDLVLYGYPHDPGAPFVVPPIPGAPAREATTRERALSDFISPQVTSPAVIEAFVSAALAHDPVRADWKQLEDYAALDGARVLAPTLVIQGERDPLAPVAAQARLFVSLANPDRQWVILAGGDHAAMIEDTHDAFIAAIRAFIERPRLRH
ncbi:MAG: alpha/beta hydrolase [Steroidobacteraceae bacterium]